MNPDTTANGDSVESVIVRVTDDVRERQKRGERPDPEEYAARFPRFASAIREVLAAVRVIDRPAPGNGPAVVQAHGALPRSFGDYELQEEIARGGEGIVFKARQISLNRPVALKMIRAGALALPADIQRFQTEARAAANLEHPNIVPIYEVGEHQGLHYFSMKLVEGGSLAAAVAQDPKSWAGPAGQRRAAQLVATVARAVHFAHQRGILHRDLKPANVLLDAEGQPHVSDFGLAKRLEGDSGLSGSGAIVGTPSYMAPEQARAQKVLTTAADVYGLGAVLYELLSGRPPFQADTPLETVRQVLDKEPDRPRLVNAAMDPDLETVCLKCLQKEPATRYGSAEALVEELGRWLRGEPIQARPAGRAERAWRWCRRNPVVAALLAALVLVFLAGSAGVLWQWQAARRNAAVAEQNAAVAEHNADVAEHNANAFRRERDTARREKDRAERHLRFIRERVDQLNRLGRELLRRPGQYRTGQAVREEGLAFYQEMLPDEGNNPKVRREAAQLFGQVAGIHQILGQARKAAEAYDRQATLLTSLLEEEPASKVLRLELADSYRYRGNALRFLGKAREAREAYGRAARLHEGLLRESPDNAGYKVALANTLLNTATLLSPRDQAGELDSLYGCILELDRAATRAAPNDPLFNSELALALGDQGLFLLDTGRGSQAQAALREALEIQQRVLAGGRLKGSVERYAARNFARLGRVLAAAGQAQEAEQSYQKAVNLLEPLVEELPESALGRADLAQTLAGQAALLESLGRRREAVAVRRQVIGHYEALTRDFPEDPQHWRDLAQSYLELIRLLWELARQPKAAGLYRKALELDPLHPAVSNERARLVPTSPEPRLPDAAVAVWLAKKTATARPQSGDYRRCKSPLGS
jgi:serine/threonine-protein kinase